MMDELAQAKRHGDRLAAGVYAWQDGLHIDAEEFVAANGYPPTAENIRTLIAGAVQVAADEGIPQVEIRDKPDGVGRNDPCPCGSGEKFKRCHGQ